MITQSKYVDLFKNVNSMQKQITETVNAQSKMKTDSVAAQTAIILTQHEQSHAKACRKSKNV